MPELEPEIEEPADLPEPDETAQLLGLLHELRVTAAEVKNPHLEDLLSRTADVLLTSHDLASTLEADLASLEAFHQKVLDAIRSKLGAEEPEDFRVFVEGVLTLAER